MRDCVVSSLQATRDDRAGKRLSVRFVANDISGHGDGLVEGGGEGFRKMIGGDGIGRLWFGLRTASGERWCVKSCCYGSLSVRVGNDTSRT
jgi:hypothetical protein